jgi:hypothetical protein
MLRGQPKGWTPCTVAENGRIVPVIVQLSYRQEVNAVVLNSQTLWKCP